MDAPIVGLKNFQQKLLNKGAKMRERTEQERLADLIGGGEDKEPVVTGDLLADGLKANLGGIHPSQIAAAAAEIESNGDIAVATVKKVGKEYSPKRVIHSEKLLLSLYDIRDGLIEAFQSCELNSSISEKIIKQIGRVGNCIIHMGGEVETFDPLQHISGLEIPDIIKNAEEVIKRTIQCYRLGKITEAKIKDDGEEISMTFEGESGNIKYTASGRIISKSWTGNEAIDYIYTPRSGKMSVKAFEGGRWITKDDEDTYNISWELLEEDLSEKYSAQNPSDEKEVSQSAQNYVEDADGEADIGTV